MTDRIVQLVGGPHDGLTFPAAPPTPLGDGTFVDGAYMLVPGELARAVYEPVEGDHPDRWYFDGWIGGHPGDVPDDELLDALAEIAAEQDRGEVL